jgi:LemA protein
MSIVLMGTALALLASAWTVAAYNGLVRRRNQIHNAFSSVDVAAKKRYDLVPALVACVRGYMEHERTLLEEIVRLRSAAQTAGVPEATRLEATDRMSAMLSRMMMLSEAYPDLKADGQFLHLQRTLTELEEQLSAARRFFNTAVTQYNDRVQSVPVSLIAPALGFGSREWFHITDGERSAPALDLAPSAEVPQSLQQER